MDFSLADDQRLMQEETGKALRQLVPLGRIREIAETPGAFADDVWNGLCALGLPGLLIREDFGGLGLGVLDAALAAEQLGRHVVPAPFAGTTVVAPLAIGLAGSTAQKQDLLPRLASGALRIGVGISEAAAGARAEAGIVCDGGRLSGRSLFVLDPAGAGLYLIADRTGSLHLVERDAAGLAATALDAVDRTHPVVMLEFDGTPAERLPESSPAVLRSLTDAGRLTLAADTLGAASHMLEAAVAYAGQRKQFGRPVGSFQAVKHICADMAAELEPCRALVWYAGYAQDRGLEDATLAACHAKSLLSDTGRMVARTATEVHGGIGITDELGLHYWFKRIGWNYQMLGSPERCRADAAALQDDHDADT